MQNTWLESMGVGFGVGVLNILGAARARYGNRCENFGGVGFECGLYSSRNLMHRVETGIMVVDLISICQCGVFIEWGCPFETLSESVG